MFTEQPFNINTLTLSKYSMLEALAYRKDVKVTYWCDKKYDYFRIKTLDEKHVLAKFVCEAYDTHKLFYKYRITLGNGELVSQGYVNNTGSPNDSEDIDFCANNLLKTLGFIAGYNETNPSLLTRKAKDNKYILQYVSNFINPGARRR